MHITLPKLPGLCPSAHGSPHKGPAPKLGTFSVILHIPDPMTSEANVWKQF